MSFQSKDSALFDIKRALQKGTFILLLKRAGFQTPRTALVMYLEWFINGSPVDNKRLQFIDERFKIFMSDEYKSCKIQVLKL